MAKYYEKKGYWKNKCDLLFAGIIRERAGKCEETGSKYLPQCAHLISRSYRATRWDFDNAICLSAARHRYYTDRPLEWEKFIEDKMGRARFEMLKTRALEYKTWTLEELKILYEELKNIRDSWDGSGGKFRLHSYQGFPIYHFKAGFDAQAQRGYGSKHWKDRKATYTRGVSYRAGSKKGLQSKRDIKEA